MTICYFGIYNPGESRNKIYMEGLQQNGVKIIECRDTSWGPIKYLKLFLKHWEIRNNYDFMIVGYPGHVVVPFAKLISRKPVILDALCSLYEGVIVSRGKNGTFFLREKYTRLIDRMAFRYADLIFVETKAQKKFCEEKLHAPLGKLFPIYTGADDKEFHPDPGIKKETTFTAVFRGKFLPEAGVQHIINAAKMLENKEVDVLILGSGFLNKKVVWQIENLRSTNLTLVSEFLPFSEIRRKMLECHVSLGQFEDHKRLSHTIPHKCFESLALGLPYVTARAEGVLEILNDGENCLYVNPADPKDLAEKILILKNNPGLASKIGKNGYKLYNGKFTPKILASQILQILQDKY